MFFRAFFCTSLNLHKCFFSDMSPCLTKRDSLYSNKHEHCPSTTATHTYTHKRRHVYILFYMYVFHILYFWAPTHTHKWIEAGVGLFTCNIVLNACVWINFLLLLLLTKYVRCNYFKFFFILFSRLLYAHTYNFLFNADVDSNNSILVKNSHVEKMKIIYYWYI